MNSLPSLWLRNNVDINLFWFSWMTVEGLTWTQEDRRMHLKLLAFSFSRECSDIDLILAVYVVVAFLSPNKDGELYSLFWHLYLREKSVRHKKESVSLCASISAINCVECDCRKNSTAESLYVQPSAGLFLNSYINLKTLQWKSSLPFHSIWCTTESANEPLQTRLFNLGKL